MPRRSPIFHIDGERGFRGGERQLLYLAAALRARGRKNVIYCRPGDALEAQARRQGFAVRPLQVRLEWDPFAAAAVAGEARRAGAIVHAHTGRAAAIGSMAALVGVPFVAHRRVDFSVGAFARRFKYGRADSVLAVSQAIADILLHAGVAAPRITVVPDAIPLGDEECRWVDVDAERYAPAKDSSRRAARLALGREFDIDRKARWIGNLAALVPHKDHDTLIAAALIVSFKRPGTVFLIAGEGPERVRLQTSITRMGLERKVILLGHREDPSQFLKAIDVYAHSSWGEGMGSALIEAQSCGVPIAATAAGGIPEVVADGETGLLAPPRKAEELAAAILRLCDDRALAERLAAAALASLPRFGLAAMAARVEAVYAAIEKTTVADANMAD